MNFFKLLFILPALSSMLMAAHFSRVNNNWLALGCLLFPLILFSKRTWAMRLFQFFLVAGVAIWLERALFLINLRQRLRLPWLRLGIIITAVAFFTLLSALIFNKQKIRDLFKKGDPAAVIPAVSASLLTAGLLIFVQFKVKTPVMLLGDRFVPGLGWLEILLLTLYAGWVAEKILDPAKTAQVRARIWLLFSVVFFGQLILGIVGIEKLLMTGKLHLPIPAMIAAGPLFRGEGIFMIILFTSTVILVGPAWCSYLCYIGALDNLAAKGKKRPEELPKWRHAARIAILVLVIATALLLRWSGVPGIAATMVGAVFGLAGVGIMAWFSRKKGALVHCITYCPIGLAANIMGKINPFRLRISDTCNDCGACTIACRYEALTKEDIKKRRAGFTCTLCGDCLTRCNDKSIHFRFAGLKPETARKLFLVMVIALHAVFLGVARI